MNDGIAYAAGAVKEDGCARGGGQSTRLSRPVPRSYRQGRPAELVEGAVADPSVSKDAHLVPCDVGVELHNVAVLLEDACELRRDLRFMVVEQALQLLGGDEYLPLYGKHDPVVEQVALEWKIHAGSSESSMTEGRMCSMARTARTTFCCGISD